MSTQGQFRNWSVQVFIGLFISLLFIAGYVRWQFDPIAAKQAGQTTSEFSAESAFNVLKHLLGDGQAHPIDSAAAKAVRERIIATLAKSGYQAEVQDTTSCSKSQKICARVQNIIAVLPGTQAGKSILASAHYDSVAASPGASDNGAGVAVLLETARLLKAQPPKKNSLIFLFTDGEEVGLLGAEAFASQHPLAAQVVAAINVEARGSSGRSVLFETGNSSGWLVSEFAKTSKQPITNSLIASAYKLLPNDTDLSVFKAHGKQGLNFAFAENKSHYHTPLDNLQNLNLGSLQQHGNNMYDLVNTLANTDLPSNMATGNLVYTDLLGVQMVYWPAAWSLIFAVLLIVGFGFASWRQRSAYRRTDVLKGVLGSVLAPALGAAVAYLLTYIFALLHTPAEAWHVSVMANRLLLWSAVLLAVIASFRLLARHSSALGLWHGMAWVWLSLALATAILMPGASYLFLIPALLLVVCALLAAFRAPKDAQQASPILLAVPGLAIFAMVVPALLIVEIMMGFDSVMGVVAMGGLLGLAATALFPFVESKPAPKLHLLLSAALGGLIVLGAVLSLRAPAYTAEQPQGLNLMYVQAQDGKALLTAGTAARRPPKAVLQAMGAETALRPAFSWNKTRFHSATVNSTGMPAATLTVLSELPVAQGRKVVAKIQAAPGTSVVQILFPKAAEVQKIEIAGQQLDYTKISDDYLSFVCRGESCNGREITLTLGKSRQTSIVVAMSAGLPAAFEAVASSRSPVAVPRDNGDQSLVVSEAAL